MRIERYMTPAEDAPRGIFAHPVLALGFRPFFLLAGLLAAVWLPLWLHVLFSGTTLPLAVDPTAWHAHEMIFGFAVAVIAGFLLTAVKNWTKQPTPSGASLAALVLLFVAGRVAMLIGGDWPAGLVAAIDVAFLPAVALAIARPIWRSRNKRNYGIPLLLLVLGLINLAFHAGGGALPRAALTAGVDVLVVFLVLVGGRVIPFFTRNAVKEANVVSRPWLDWSAFGLTLALVPVHLFGLHAIAAPLALAAAVANLARLAGWNPTATLTRPILWVLHLGYLWIGLGLLMLGLSPWVPALGGTAPLHALTVGALGTLILGMMSRVSLGHTGRPLVVSRVTVAGYVLLTAAALARVVIPLASPAHYPQALMASGTLWAAAFALFVGVYWRILTTPRPDGAPG